MLKIVNNVRCYKDIFAEDSSILESNDGLMINNGTMEKFIDYFTCQSLCHIICQLSVLCVMKISSPEHYYRFQKEFTHCSLLCLRRSASLLSIQL